MIIHGPWEPKGILNEIAGNDPALTNFCSLNNILK